MNTSSRKLAGLLAAVAVLAVAGCASRNGGGQPLRFSVMTYNIHHGEGMDGRLDLERIAALTNEHRPDLVALQEVDQGVTRTQGRDIAGELATLTGMNVVFGKNIDYQGGDYGNAILSRFQLSSAGNHHYRMLREGEQRGLLRATVTHPSGREIVFMATHLDHRPDPAERLSNVPEIMEALAAHPGRPVIVAGDFNDLPGREVHQRMKTAFIDAWEASGGGDGFTYSSTNPNRRIDYIYLNERAGWGVHGARVLPSLASDHLPLMVEVEVP